MDLATMPSVVRNVLTAIQTLEQLKATFSLSHQEDELQHLQKTVKAVQSVLEDADANQDALSRQQTDYIEELKDLVYDNVDDVLDEFVTLVKHKQAIEATDEVSNTARSFLSRFRLRILNLIGKVMGINNKLDDMVSNSSKFMFKVDHKAVMFVNQGTSYVSIDDPIVGRGEDLEKIVEMLLNSGDGHQPCNVLSLAIVGMGGLGKTALAQLIYNDPRITSAFQLKIWTSIADHDKWNLSHILGKIVGHDHGFATQEEKHYEIKKKLEGKKYLLVLDDVWTETYTEWQELEKYLMVGKSRSRLVVTTRSKLTAQIVGGVRVHELQGLSENDSCRLFETMAFRAEQTENLDDDMVKLVKDIVKKCLNVPLAIRVVGSLLHGESSLKWLSFRDKELTDISESDDTVNKMLRLSYYNLDSSLKTCFAYCAIFPKDFTINKQLLLSLWMAQGYIVVENVGEEYIRILLQRCFFQEVKENVVGEIKWFKIHDLLHDIAEQETGTEVCRSNSDPFNLDRKVRHLSLLHGYCPQATFSKARIRSCLQVKEYRCAEWRSDQLLAGKLIANWSYLRSLDLSWLRADRLPESIGKLIHLRYLNLAYSKNLKVLPNSFTKLVNLQTLDLFFCLRLEELPKDVCKLVDLSTLNITRCDKLNHMPSRLELLTHLHTLGLFVVGEQHCFTGLEVLRNLNKLKGSLQIRINVDKNAKYVKGHHGGGAYLIGKVHLYKIYITFTNRACESIEWEQALLEEMQPHDNIRGLILEGYSGETMPRWPRREDNSTSFYFPNLANLQIHQCQQLRFPPSLEKLLHLTKLKLWELDKLEYIINVDLEACRSDEGSSFFPCLEYLDICSLPRLKGWWPRLVSEEQNEQLIGEPFTGFGQLKGLTIEDCPVLKSIPICSHLNTVQVHDYERSMYIKDMDQLPSNYKCLWPTDS